MSRLVELFGLWRKKDRPGSTSLFAVRELITSSRALLSNRSEVSGARIAAEILEAYQALDRDSRVRFFDSLARAFSPDPVEVGEAGDAYRNEPSPETLAQLLRVVEPRRQELFRRLNMAPGGTRVLVEMRAEILEKLHERALWKPIEADLAHLLTSWFNRGFLLLRRIDWQTSANILEKLIRYEAVHEIQGWKDLQRRLEADRRCYAFFHPVLPDEPIIFIEVALTRGLSSKVQPLLDPSAPVLNPETADCAIFYSITNCQTGLRGVPLGSFLIKQVVEDLSRDLPRLKTFATLSPIPGFRKWLNDNRENLTASDEGLREVLAHIDDTDWSQDQERCEAVRQRLVPLCAHYLLSAKQAKEPYDSVARFHLRNGARLERINWLSDTSPTGMNRSAGLMTNYVYRLGDIERNHELYSREYKIRASYEVEQLAKNAQQGPRVVKKSAPASQKRSAS